MNRTMRLIPLVLLAIFSLLLALGVFNKPQRQDSVTPSMIIGYGVALFEVPALAQPEKIFSPAVWKNQVIVLNVFASWCEPCAAEHQVLMKLAQSGKVAIYGIAWKDKADKVIAWINARGNPYQMIGLDETGKSTIPLALSGVPETLVIGRDGKIAYNYKSVITDEIVSRDILPLVERLYTNNVSAAAR